MHLSHIFKLEDLSEKNDSKHLNSFGLLKYMLIFIEMNVQHTLCLTAFYIHVFISIYFYWEGVHSMTHICRTVHKNVRISFLSPLCLSQGFISSHVTLASTFTC